MKSFNFKNIIKSFLVIGMLLSLITPAYANEAPGDARQTLPDVTVTFVSDIPCVGLSEPIVVPAESATTAKVLMPDPPTAKGYIFQGYRRITYTDNGIVEGRDLWDDGDYLRVSAIEDSKVYFRVEWIPVYDHADIPSFNYDKSYPVEKWSNLQFVESAEFSHILIDGEVMPESGYTIEPSFTIDDYASTFLLTLNNDYLNTLEVGDYKLEAVTTDNRTNKISLSIYDANRITFKFNYRGGTGHFEYRESIDPPTGNDTYIPVTDFLEVRRGTPVTLCGVADEGYDGYQLDRNGHALHGTCDKFIAGDTGDHVDYLYYMVVDNQELTVTPGGHDFGIAQVGYDPIQGYRIKIENTGHRNIDLKNFRRDRGFETEKFVFSKFDCYDLEDYDGIFLSHSSYCNFTVRPKDGLPVGKHNEVIDFTHLERDPDRVEDYPNNVIDEVNVGQLNLYFEVLEEVIAEPKVDFTTANLNLGVDFGAELPGYEIDQVKQVEFENTGNVGLNLEKITAKHFDVGPLECREGIVDDNYTIPVGEKCKFEVKPKADLAIGTYEETINIYNKTAVTYGVDDSDIITPVGSFKAKFVVKDPAPKKVQIDFTYNIDDSAYVKINNRTIGEKVEVTDKYIANENDSVLVCAYAKEGYRFDKLVRSDGKENGGNCDFIGAEDIGYHIVTSKATAPELKTELKLSPTSLDFVQTTAGYKPVAVKQVTMRNTGDTDITIDPLTSQNYIIGGLDCGSGVDKDNFSIPVGSTCKFDVKPREGLRAGEYAETIKVTANNTELASFNVKFVVNEAVEEKVNLYFTYNNPDSAYIYYENLTTEETGRATDKLTLNKGDEIEVCPVPTEDYIINAVTRDGTNLESECDKFSAVADVHYHISTEEALAEVTFSPAIYDFGEIAAGYAPIAVSDIELENTGNIPVNITKLSAENFIISDLQCDNFDKYDDIYSIPEGAKCKFTAKPKDGLAPGVYNETINIYDQEVQPLSIEANDQAEPIGKLVLRFMVKGDITSLTLDPSSLDFGQADEGYPKIVNKAVSLKNTGNTEIAIEQLSSENFVIGDLGCDNYQKVGDKYYLPANAECKFIVRPKDGLTAGTYNETISIKNQDDVLAKLELRFTVKAGITSLTLDPSSLDFGQADEGYPKIVNKAVSLKNTGNTEIAIEQLSSENFVIGDLGCDNYQKVGDKYYLPANAECKFIVRPKDGLTAGTYNETISIKNQDDVLANLDLKFVVNEVIPETVDISFGYEVEGSAYVEYENLTTGETGTAPAKLVVNKGDRIKLCAYANEGYLIDTILRNGTDVIDGCDEIVANADTSYYISVDEEVTSLTLDPSSLDFGQKDEGYDKIVNKAVTLKNTGNTEIAIEQLSAENFIIGELGCDNYQKVGDKYYLPANAECKFTVRPKDDLTAGTYTETISVNNQNDTLANLNLKFVVNEVIPETVDINFIYNIKDSAYIDYYNETVGEHGWLVDQVTVNKGDKISVCAFEKEGYLVRGMKRNDVELNNRCDTIIAEEDTTYYITAVENVKELTVEPTSLDFGQTKVGYNPIKEMTFTVTNTGTADIYLDNFAAKNYTIANIECEGTQVGAYGIYLHSNDSCKFSIKPKDGLAVGNYAETINFKEVKSIELLSEINDSNDESLGSLKLNFIVEAETDEIPETGDDSHMMLYGTISAGTLALAIYLDKKRKATK